MPRSPGSLIYSRFQQARARTREIEDRELSPKEFLDLIDPGGKRSEASAARYLRKLRSGERSGANIKKRADADGGRVVNVRFKVGTYKDKSGVEYADIRSANIRLPVGKSRLDLWQGNRLRRAVNAYLRKSYSRRVDGDTDRGDEDKYVPLRALPPGATLDSITRISGSRYPTEILR